MFSISIKKNFKAAHALRGLSSGDEDVHWHDWVCEIVFSSIVLDKAGCVVDFLEADKTIIAILKNIEGAVLNDIKPFDDISPSTENIAKHIYDMMAVSIKRSIVKLERVSVWEDALHMATYYER